jgi:hypothetical protein
LLILQLEKKDPHRQNERGFRCLLNNKKVTYFYYFKLPKTAQKTLPENRLTVDNLRSLTRAKHSHLKHFMPPAGEQLVPVFRH